jgi:modification methylase
MKTTISMLNGTAAAMTDIGDAEVDLVVTSPPYPMVGMWDEIFAAQDCRVGLFLDEGRGREAFESMHALLDRAWAECERVLKPGGLACVNIGDATRTLGGEFQLYANHARILGSFLDRGFAALPDILWRKPTNAPNKFMGSGMLPVGAYVTYEHEYILVLRKGRRRKFAAARDQARRRESAFFWEERNRWFSDIWSDVKGTAQRRADAAARERSGAFPFELAHRLICMFSVKEDLVLDPFAGTGTTLAAALAAGRNAVGVELDGTFLPVARASLLAMTGFANRYNRDRLSSHLRFAAERTAARGPLAHTNVHYGFPVMTAQERELLINEVLGVAEKNGVELTVHYGTAPQTDLPGA